MRIRDGKSSDPGYTSPIRKTARIVVKNLIRIRIKIKNQKLQRLKTEPWWRPWTLTMEAWRLKMEPRRVYKLVVADSHHFGGKQDLDTDPHSSEKLNPDPDPH